ncbi:unnamed protein product [Peniophora sp. CBMAI 1063]|nr:unnamed protein product [Peniophora sp. CBMAI 1063]
MDTFGKESAIAKDDRASASEFWPEAYEGRAPCIPTIRTAWAEEVEALGHIFADAKARLNAFSPIYMVPDEILAYIFELLVPLHPIRLSDYDLGWVSVTHVTRRFRAVAIDHATLWTTLSLDRDTPWAVFLTRARDALFTIRGSVGWESNPGDGTVRRLALGASIFRRARTLDIDRIGSHAYSWLQTLFSENAPELRTLSLQVYEYYLVIAEHAEDAEPEWPVLDTQFLAQRAPMLTSLAMVGMRMPWCIPSTISLRSLILDIFDDAQRSDYTFVDMLHCLDNMPMLEELVLWRAIPIADSASVNAPGPAEKRITLSRLGLLFVADALSRCLIFWSSLNIPPACSIRIDGEELDAYEECLLPSLIKDHFSKPRIPAYDYVQIGDTGGDEPLDDMIRVYLRVGIPPAYPSSGCRVLNRRNRESFSIDSGPALTFRLPSEQLDSIIGLIPREPVKALSLAEWLPSPGFDDSVAWVVETACVYFNSIETLQICGLSPLLRPFRTHQLARLFNTASFDQLSPRMTANPSEFQDTRRCMPSLRTLSLDNVRLLRWFEDEETELNVILNEVLEARITAGMPVHTLRISNTRISKAWLETWANLVQEVHLVHPTVAINDDDDDGGERIDSDTGGEDDVNAEDEVLQVDFTDDEVEVEVEAESLDDGNDTDNS